MVRRKIQTWLVARRSTPRYRGWRGPAGPWERLGLEFVRSVAVVAWARKANLRRRSFFRTRHRRGRGHGHVISRSQGESGVERMGSGHGNAVAEGGDAGPWPKAATPAPGAPGVNAGPSALERGGGADRAPRRRRRAAVGRGAARRPGRRRPTPWPCRARGPAGAACRSPVVSP